MKYRTRPTILPDISKLHPVLRDPDRLEVEALGSNPRTALIFGYLNGPCFTGLVDEEVLCIFGVVKEGRGGRIWMLSSRNIEGHARAVCRLSIREVRKFKQDYRVLFNIVDERNTMTIKWLDWLGFQFGKSHTINSHSFKEFYTCHSQ